MNNDFKNSFEKVAKIGRLVDPKVQRLFDNAPTQLKSMFSPLDMGVMDKYNGKGKSFTPRGMYIIGENGAGDLMGYKNGSYYDYNHEMFPDSNKINSWEKY